MNRPLIRLYGPMTVAVLALTAMAWGPLRGDDPPPETSDKSPVQTGPQAFAGAMASAMQPSSTQPQIPPLYWPKEDRDPEGTAVIEQILDTKLPMQFPDGSYSLEEVLDFIERKTVTINMDFGIPIYVDPMSIKSLNQEVTIDLVGVKLRTCLVLVLDQLDAGFVVRDGVLIIAGRSRGDLLTPVGSVYTPPTQFFGLGDFRGGGGGGGFSVGGFR